MIERHPVRTLGLLMLVTLLVSVLWGWTRPLGELQKGYYDSLACDLSTFEQCVLPDKLTYADIPEPQKGWVVNGIRKSDTEAVRFVVCRGSTSFGYQTPTATIECWSEPLDQVSAARFTTIDEMVVDGDVASFKTTVSAQPDRQLRLGESFKALLLGGLASFVLWLVIVLKPRPSTSPNPSQKGTLSKKERAKISRARR